MDDVWGDGSDDGEGYGELERERRARQETYKTGVPQPPQLAPAAAAAHQSGYRDGLTQGKNKTLQEGFDMGFREGCEEGFRWGEVRGAASTLQVFVGQVAGTSELRDQVSQLNQRIQSAADAAMVAACNARLTKAPEGWGAAAFQEGGGGGEAEGAAAAADVVVEGAEAELLGLGIKLKSST